MNIVDLTDEHKKLYCVCLEDWSDEMKEAGDHKLRWYEIMKNRGLRVKLALDDNGDVGGMIQYLPAEESFIDGEGLYFIPCIWVHGHDKGRGDFRKRGMGTALLKAAEDDVYDLGGLGMAAWGITLPFWMRSAWYKKHGYKKADRRSFMELVWKPFIGSVLPPNWIKRKKTPEKVPGQVTVTAFLSGWCPSMNIMYERAKRASAEFADRVMFRTIDTVDRSVFLEWGISDDIYMDDKKITKGAPLPYYKIHKYLEKKVKKLK